MDHRELPYHLVIDLTLLGSDLSLTEVGKLAPGESPSNGADHSGV